MKRARLIVYGGSIPAGRGVLRPYPGILKQRLMPLGIEVIDRSREGATSFAGVENYAERVAPHCPAILILHFGIDDAFSGVYRSEFKENLVRMVRLAKEDSRLPVFLCTSHFFPDAQEREAAEIVYRAMREVAADLRCFLVPVHLFWESFLLESGMENPDLLQADTRYPNEKGHEVYAEAIWRALITVKKLKMEAV